MVVLCGFKWQIIQKCWCEKSENPLVVSVRHEKRTPPISLKQKMGQNGGRATSWPSNKEMIQSALGRNEWGYLFLDKPKLV